MISILLNITIIVTHSTVMIMISQEVGYFLYYVKISATQNCHTLVHTFFHWPRN